MVPNLGPFKKCENNAVYYGCLPWVAAAAEEDDRVSMVDSASGLFLFDKSTGELLPLASLWVTAGWSEVCCSGVAAAAAVAVLLVDGCITTPLINWGNKQNTNLYLDLLFLHTNTNKLKLPLSSVWLNDRSRVKVQKHTPHFMTCAS